MASVHGSRNPLRFFNWFRSRKDDCLPGRGTRYDAGAGGDIKGNVYYDVKVGDTLESIARQFDIDSRFLVEANDILNPKNISPGQVLWIPKIYVVKKGDTLLDIATLFGVPMARLQEVNGIEDPDFIFEGDALVIPPTPAK
ncbi:hypothetical protein CBR_g41652 [Chara braunii]|uniref:LysM domain-containing protein n=1 Tax=Chara braunii TaxID=69332 RepID=A0A388LW81_CHABU|nr:hypothetical protein CBR_g41652 [Chara braunii]|eukprot:GBG86587.1 hypothetical protein CBR_g41652 [Chara braunii]